MSKDRAYRITLRRVKMQTMEHVVFADDINSAYDAAHQLARNTDENEDWDEFWIDDTDAFNPQIVNVTHFSDMSPREQEQWEEYIHYATTEL